MKGGRCGKGGKGGMGGMGGKGGRGGMGGKGDRDGMGGKGDRGGMGGKGDRGARSGRAAWVAGVIGAVAATLVKESAVATGEEGTVCPYGWQEREGRHGW